jgi:2-amino-4-hydroxy-6-hydroxymethyldihydropteridine diphosphokinase
MLWYPAYVGIGSNLDEPAQQVGRAFAALSELPQSRLILKSSLYGSTPMGPAAQPDFVNAVAGMLTQLEAGPFFNALRALESALGRVAPRVRWGARRIDLDLLVFASQRLDSPQLTLPHPGIVQRNFVLYPLFQVAPALQLPGLGPLDELAARADPAGIWRLDGTSMSHGA